MRDSVLEAVVLDGALGPVLSSHDPGAPLLLKGCGSRGLANHKHTSECWGPLNLIHKEMNPLVPSCEALAGNYFKWNEGDTFLGNVGHPIFLQCKVALTIPELSSFPILEALF